MLYSLKIFNGVGNSLGLIETALAKALKTKRQKVTWVVPKGTGWWPVASRLIPLWYKRVRYRKEIYSIHEECYVMRTKNKGLTIEPEIFFQVGKTTPLSFHSTSKVSGITKALSTRDDVIQTMFREPSTRMLMIIILILGAVLCISMFLNVMWIPTGGGTPIPVTPPR